MGVVFCLPNSHTAVSFISPSPSFLLLPSNPRAPFSHNRRNGLETVLFWRRAARGFCDSSRLLRVLFTYPRIHSLVADGGGSRKREQEVLPVLTLSRAAPWEDAFHLQAELTGYRFITCMNRLVFISWPASDRSHGSD